MPYGYLAGMLPSMSAAGGEAAACQDCFPRLLGRLCCKGRETSLLCSPLSFERQASNWQEEFLLWKAPWGLGSSFRNLCGYSLEGNKKERNKEVGIPRAEILDMLWGCAKEQN